MNEAEEAEARTLILEEVRQLRDSMTRDECSVEQTVEYAFLSCHHPPGHPGDHYDDDVGVFWSTV